MPLEKLFCAVDETNHVYTWDYTVRERAIALLDVNKECFALITEREEIDDETGAMGDYRESSEFFGYLYSKYEPKPAEIIPHGTRRANFVELSSKIREDLVDKIKRKTSASGIEEVESIALDVGRVYISDGCLLLDRIQP